jgi:diaminopimelate decarboxylase
VHPAGLHVHLGSQIRDTGTYTDAVDWLVSFIEENGLGELGTLDLGGGFAIAHRDDEIELPVEDGVEEVVLHLAQRLIAHGLPMPELILEPGRSIAGPSGVTLYTVGAIKQVGDGTVFAAVDGGMSDNPRPALYGARYDAIVCDRADAAPQRTYDIAGKHCETGDVLIEDAFLPELKAGDVLAVPATGAYTASMASNYNQLPGAGAGVVGEGGDALIQRRETAEDLLQREL